MGAIVSETIRNDNFREEVENVISITKPIYLLIKFADGEGPKIGEFYENMDKTLRDIKEI